MRQTFRCAFLIAALQITGLAHAQVSAPPAAPKAPARNFGQAQDANDASSKASGLVTQAENEIVRGEYAKAIPLLNSALSREKDNSAGAARTLYDLGYVEQQMHRIPAAEADYRRANTANPKQFESHAALGRLFADREHWKQARQQLELAAGLQPASGDPRQLLADVARTLARVDAQLGDRAAASDALVGALRLTPEQPDDTLLAARLAEEEGNATGAENEYRKVLTADPKSTEAAEGLARVLIHQGKFSEAEPIIQQGLKQAPNDPIFLADSAAALAGEGKNDAAREQLQMLHQQNPNQPAITRMLADLDSSTGEATKAGPLYQQLVQTTPNNPDLLTAQGENLIREQKWAQAVEVLQHSLNVQPQQEDAWSSLAFAALQDRDYPLVLSALDHRATYLADGPATLFLRASALDHLHRNKEAVVYYRKFLDQAHGGFPDEQAEAQSRLAALSKSRQAPGI